MRSLVVALAVLAVAGAGRAATQSILGGTFDVRTPYGDGADVRPAGARRFAIRMPTAEGCP